MKSTNSEFNMGPGTDVGAAEMGPMAGSEVGATIAEYALLLALISFPALLILPLLGSEINTLFQSFLAAF